MWAYIDYSSLTEKSPYSEIFWSVFSHIGTEYKRILHISPYSIRMRENAEQNNSEYGHFLRSASHSHTINKLALPCPTHLTSPRVPLGNPT